MSMSDLFGRRAAGRYVNDFFETEYIDDNEQRHRDDGPAYIDAEGNQAWYKHGKLHRDGLLPAVECTDGRKEYWENGVQLTPETVEARKAAQAQSARDKMANDSAALIERGLAHDMPAPKKIHIRKHRP